MNPFLPIPKRVELAMLLGIMLLFLLMSLVGISWGLPSRDIDRYLFGDNEPWSGEKIYRLAGATEKFSPRRGADVDVDPLQGEIGEPILLTGTEEDVAKIYLRYRLYTYQPDEMITMMALAGMNPNELRLDPRLYQYGGLFIYPVGALIGAAGAVGLIDVRSDVVYYLDSPDEFGKFYIVARAYAAVWGLIGVVVVFAIARRLGGSRAGLLAALLFTLMPVVVCMAHEGKPHLPGAVLMLMAVYFAMRHLAILVSSPDGASSSAPPLSQGGNQSEGMRGGVHRNWWLMCLCCGAAFGMVLSSAPIFVLIPLVAWLEARGGALKRSVAVADSGGETPGTAAYGRMARRAIVGICVAFGVYLVTNPYVLINALTNREVLASNFGNSFAMYEISRIGEGFVRVLELTIEGVTLPVLVFGVIGLAAAFLGRTALVLPLAIAALVFFLQFVLIGAGKPAEYGRFGVFTNTALAIGTACLLTRRWTKLREAVNWMPAMCVTSWILALGLLYLMSFRMDAAGSGSRHRLSAIGVALRPHVANLGPIPKNVYLTVVPAPYSCPPMNFAATYVYMFPTLAQCKDFVADAPAGVVAFSHVDERAVPYWDDVSSSFIDLRPEWRKRVSLLFRPSAWHKLRDAPISWANKPFEVLDPVLPWAP